MPVRQLQIKNFPYGLIDSVEAKSIPRGSASFEKNFLTKGDKIELRRGQARLGLTENSGNVKITGLGIAIRADGTQIPVRKRARKIEYYDSITDDWVEIGTNIIPSEAEDDFATIEAYAGITGYAVFINSPNMQGPIKLMAANLDDYIDLKHTTNFGGYIKIKQNRTFLWNRGRTSTSFTQFDQTGLYGSYIDKDEATDFTQVSAEAIGGSGQTRTGTLAFKAGGSRRNCFEVTFTDTNEVFVDDLNGNLNGNNGGSGTINYVTGEYSITFGDTVAGSVTATYRHEDSASGGIADFSKSSPRTAGQGFVFRQDDGGEDFKNLFSVGGTEYCFHRKGAWATTLSADDTEATNLIYRKNIGIPSLWGGVETGEGIYIIDDSDENDTHFRLLSLDLVSENVIPESVSKAWKIESLNEKVGISLEDYRFENAVVSQVGQFIVFQCRSKDADENDTMFAYDRIKKTIDRLDGYYASTLAIYNGSLIAGDALSPNVYTLFSGFDDDGVEIFGDWISGEDDLENSDQLKKVKKLIVRGEIGVDQVVGIEVSPDNGPFVEIGQISGQGDYVDTGDSVAVGAVTLGRSEIGGGSSGVTAYRYVRELDIGQDKFNRIRIRFVPTGIGYFSVSEWVWKDIRLKERKIPTKYRG